MSRSPSGRRRKLSWTQLLWRGEMAWQLHSQALGTQTWPETEYHADHREQCPSFVKAGSEHRLTGTMNPPLCSKLSLYFFQFFYNAFFKCIMVTFITGTWDTYITHLNFFSSSLPSPSIFSSPFLLQKINLPASKYLHFILLFI